jgi:hypothetical protein
MVEEKEYFNFKIGKFNFCLNDHYEYTDRKTGKIHMNKRFMVYTYNDDDGYQHWLEYYTGWHKPRFVYDTCGYEDNRHSLSLTPIYGQIWMYFPWRNKNVFEEDVNNPQPKYGFYLYGERKLFDSFWYYKNKDGHSDVKCIYMPWSLDFYRRSYLTHVGWLDCLESERVKARSRGEDTFKYPYYLYDDDERLIKKEFPFKYVTKYGEVQETIATCYMEEMEWRPKWLKWTKLFNLVKTSLDISFKDEMGSERGSWKGGVCGVGCNVTKEEKESQDFETPLRRYEKEVNRIHDYDK